jgi:hypothetical protein
MMGEEDGEAEAAAVAVVVVRGGASFTRSICSTERRWASAGGDDEAMDGADGA